MGPYPDCGHSVLPAVLHTIVTCAGKDCGLSACGPCARLGREAELVGEGPLGACEEGPVWIERLDPFSECGACAKKYCSACADDSPGCGRCAAFFLRRC